MEGRSQRQREGMAAREQEMRETGRAWGRGAERHRRQRKKARTKKGEDGREAEARVRA